MNEPRLGEPGKANDKRLRILHIAGWYPSRENPVAGVFVREHVKATSLYNDVAVLYGEGVNKEIRGLYQIKDNIEDGIRTLRLRYRKSPIPKTSYFVYMWAMFRAFRKLAEEGFRPDVIHAHVYSAGVPAVLMGKRYGLPVVITEHFTGFPRGLVRGIEKLKAKFAFERAAVVCPVSNDLRTHIERRLGVRARFHVVPNVVDTSLFSPPAARSAREDGRKRLLVVALLTPKKGIPYLLEALARLRERRDDFVLDIVGDGPNRSEYEVLTNKLGLQDVVRFHGLKTKQEVAELMKRCDVFVLPSLFETFGVVLIEALACGMPVVATDIGGPNEIVTDEVGCLVPPADTQALARAIDYMLNHCGDYVPERIAQYAEGRYSYQAVGSKLNQLYRSVLRQRL
ncbi:glycosyltransferase [Candidatus Bipolaricaulota bacterium]|nr:glycosyltransferase [Candidatus Bipolaricaulota bacterium]